MSTGATGSGVGRASVVVVIPTWNRRDDLLRCLQTLAGQTHSNVAVVVVDNGSEDGTAAAVRAAHPACVVLRHRLNLGYAGGNNAGIRWALAHGADYVLLVNNDTEVPPGLVNELMQVATATPRLGAAGARNLVLDDPYHLWGAYGVLTYGPFVVRTAGQGVTDSPRWRVVKDVDWVIGNGMLLSRSALEEVGLLDDNFFAYHEDVDWCVRARRAGYRIVYAGTAAILHRGGGSSAAGQAHRFPQAYFLGRNGVLFAQKHGRWPDRVRFGALCGGAFAARFVRAGLYRALPGRCALGSSYWETERAFCRGMTDALRGRPVSFARLGLRNCAMPGAEAGPVGPGGDWALEVE